MMIVLTITGSIGCEPVCSIYWRSEHMQLRVMCSDEGAFRRCVGCDQTMNQPLRYVRTAVHSYTHESDDALAAGDYEPVVACRKCAQRLHHGSKLRCLEGRK